MKTVAACLVALLLMALPARSQSSTPGLPMVPQGYCQLGATALGSAVGLSSCVRAAFTGTGSGANMTTTSVTGIILVGDGVAGTGVPAGTTIISQTSGTVGGGGVYVTSAATTSSSASLTSGGIPPRATMVFLTAATASVSYRDDGGVPTASVGVVIPSGLPGLLYVGTLNALQFIAVSGSPVLNVAFYR